MDEKVKKIGRVVSWINDKHVVPNGIDDIWIELLDRGYATYVVGGAVRDLLSREVPNDWDLVTSATPLQIKRVFGVDRVILDAGLNFGVTIVKYGNETVEIATMRKEYGNKKSRGGTHSKPDVKYTKSMRLDSKRRDFTVNALYLDRSGKVYDPSGTGLEHVNQKVLDFNGVPSDRLKEDIVRLYRGIRLIGRGYKPTKSTITALVDIKNNRTAIKQLPNERIRKELLKMMDGDLTKIFSWLNKSGLLKFMLPEWIPMIDYDQNTPYHLYNLDTHSIKTAERMRSLLRNEGESDNTLVLIALLHDIGKPSTKSVKRNGQFQFIGHEKIGADMIEIIFKRLSFSKRSITRANRLLYYHMHLHQGHSLKTFLKLGDKMDKHSIKDRDIIWLYMSDLWASRKEVTYLLKTFEFPRIQVGIRSAEIMDLLEKHYSAIYPKNLISIVTDKMREFYYRKPNEGKISMLDKLRGYIINLKKESEK